MKEGLSVCRPINCVCHIDVIVFVYTSQTIARHASLVCYTLFTTGDYEVHLQKVYKLVSSIHEDQCEEKQKQTD